jgi:hypothetical protein
MYINQASHKTATHSRSEYISNRCHFASEGIVENSLLHKHRGRQIDDTIGSTPSGGHKKEQGGSEDSGAKAIS